MALDLLRNDPADGGALVTTRCRRCGFVSFPPRPVCARCGREEMERALGGRHGRIVSSAVVHNAPIGFQAPYVIALVRLDEGPVVFCPITGCAPDAAAVPPGAPVELVVAPARPGGTPVMQYRPAAR